MTVDCTVSLKHVPENSVYRVALRHYEELKDRLDRQEKGWVELDSIWGDGRLLVRLEDITELFKSTEGYAEARDHWDEEQRQEKLRTGEP